MSDYQTEEGSLRTPDGIELYTKTWKSTGPLKARVVFIHGFSDHCNLYEPLFPVMAKQGITTYSYDQRGWGRSVHEKKQKGLSGPTTQVIDDISTFIRSLPKDHENVPLFLMGHSMGGAETLVYAATGPPEIVSKIRGFLVESPFIALHPATRPWRLTVVLGRLAGRLLPHWPMLNKLDSRLICRDPDVCTEYERDELCHDTGTLEGLAGMLDRAAELEDGKVVLREGVGENGKTRVWVGHGTADGICSFDACRKWYEGLRVEDKEFRAYEGWYHRLHAEPGEDKKVFARDVVGWVLDRVEGGSERAKL